MVLTVVDSDSNSGFSLSFKVDSQDVKVGGLATGC